MKRRRVIGFLLALALMGCLLPIHALAIDLMDPERPVDLTVISKFDGAALAGERFDLYKVATADEQCRMTPTEAFRPYISGDLNKMESWEKLNKALYKAVLASPEKFPIAYTGETDEGGKAEFTVDAGLYLILGRPHIQNNRLFTQNPILLMLPNRPEGRRPGIIPWLSTTSPRSLPTPGRSR